MKKIVLLSLLFAIQMAFAAPEPKKYTATDINLKRDFLYNKYTLDDTYPYLNGTRSFQWDKIKEALAKFETFQSTQSSWIILQNKSNINGVPPVARQSGTNESGNTIDQYGTEKHQNIPLYLTTDNNRTTPERYALDGSLFCILPYGEDQDFVKAESAFYDGQWLIPVKYVRPISDTIARFNHVIFVDRTNQNIATLEKSGSEWLIRSMNPCTTGLQKLPYQKQTPLGIFVIQQKKKRMEYYKDGTTQIGGFAPYASRFCNGGYIHGVPVNLPAKEIVEYSSTLGTTPRSHMCVRNATSHALYLFEWAPLYGTIIFVIE